MMSLSKGWRAGTCLTTVVAVLLVAGRLWADEVTLRSGATVRGHASEVTLPNHSKAVEIRTSTGALLVLERDAVEQIKRGPAAGSKPKQAANKPPRLTAEEQAWMSKVRALVLRSSSNDRDQRRRARTELQNISDPDALPALTRYLQQNPDEELRSIYVSIVRRLPGQNTVYSLVNQSLFDSSPLVRQQAREAIGAERADSARTLYIFALKLRDATLATRAALGIQEVGDPNGDAIPYLIEALVNESTRQIILPKTVWVEAVDWSAFFENARIHIVSEHAGPMGLYDNPPIRVGPMRAMKGAAAAAPAAPPAPVQMVPIDVPVISTLHDKDGNQPVLETLLKVTTLQPGFGYNRDKWRSWWANEKTNRDLQKRQADTPISK